MERSLGNGTRRSRPSSPARRGLKAELRDLAWGQLNFLHTTDTHGWHAGHLQEAQYSADWGDYVSFAHHMRKKADDNNVDLLVIDTGDRVEGNGLYDASNPKGLFTYDIFKEQNVDIICSGNHELYRSETAEREVTHNIPNFKGRYLASNLDYINPKTGEQEPMAQRYRRFKTKNQGIDIVAFGFLFDFTGNDKNTVVIPARQVIKEEWFQNAIREDADVFIIIGHVGLRMEELKLIHRAIRQANWNSPILVFAGHAHVRDAVNFDAKAAGIASGRYFETIGWMSVEGLKTKEKNEVEDRALNAGLKFHRRYIDNNVLGMYHHSGLDGETFPTEHGRNVSAAISRARKVLDLDYKYGCAPKTLWLTRAAHDGEDSIFTWLNETVLPDVVTKKGREENARVAIFNTGGIRFDIFKGAFTRDSTYLVSPFISTLKYIPDVPYDVARKVITILNSGGHIFSGSDLDPRYMALPQKWAGKDLRQAPTMPGPRLELRGDSEQIRLSGDGEGSRDKDKDKDKVRTEGYTTEDDFGKDGDDTVHAPVPYFNVPNCIQSEIGFPEKDDPEKVDLVFIEFITPFILQALTFAGGIWPQGRRVVL
ncbi:unnamed protein product [Parascedosporium putredinis]|uniref:Putative 5'-nucleotidase C-terminal domain-containing protein n=1 Tax=Parascedosporium putredinis TaxID=1442378 RepID=A0A9P1GWJ4_9PEZI|nr:unnamed protein product [Parascedosporium putredinis]CAI7988289.1 unnamed protein product [Parascedosporium putredinis]